LRNEQNWYVERGKNAYIYLANGHFCPSHFMYGVLVNIPDTKCPLGNIRGDKAARFLKILNQISIFQFPDSALESLLEKVRDLKFPGYGIKW
jgi:hypothetical protein